MPWKSDRLDKKNPRSKLIWKKIVQNISHFVVKYLKFIERKLPPKTKDIFLLLGWESFVFTGAPAPATICKLIQFWNIKHGKDKENCLKASTKIFSLKTENWNKPISFSSESAGNNVQFQNIKKAKQRRLPQEHRQQHVG